MFIVCHFGGSLPHVKVCQMTPRRIKISYFNEYLIHIVMSRIHFCSVYQAPEIQFNFILLAPVHSRKYIRKLTKKVSQGQMQLLCEIMLHFYTRMMRIGDDKYCVHVLRNIPYLFSVVQYIRYRVCSIISASLYAYFISKKDVCKNSTILQDMIFALKAHFQTRIKIPNLTIIYLDLFWSLM